MSLISFCYFSMFRYSNELLGLEGMVKIKNPDENLLNGNHTISIGDSDTKISTNDITDSKRSRILRFFFSN